LISIKENFDDCVDAVVRPVTPISLALGGIVTSTAELLT
jgi:hypothetical protein